MFFIRPQASVQGALSSSASLDAAIDAEAPFSTNLGSATIFVQPSASVQSTQSSALPATEAAEAHGVCAATDTAAVHMPAKQLPTYTGVEMVVSKGAVQGWVEQASPYCGAASVAEAWNAVRPARLPLMNFCTSLVFTVTQLLRPSALDYAGCVHNRPGPKNSS